MLRIKLSRTGAKNWPAYRVVVTERRSKVTGKPVASLGYFHPMEKRIEIDRAGYEGWVAKGAQPTSQVEKLLAKKG